MQKEFCWMNSIFIQGSLLSTVTQHEFTLSSTDRLFISFTKATVETISDRLFISFTKATVETISYRKFCAGEIRMLLTK